jgi:hypothetical protein
LRDGEGLDVDGEARRRSHTFGITSLSNDASDVQDEPGHDHFYLKGVGLGDRLKSGQSVIVSKPAKGMAGTMMV